MNEVLRSLHALNRGALQTGRVHSRMVFRLAAVFLCLIAGPVFATTFTVTSRANSGPGSLRQAIADASAAGGDVIQFAVTGTINLENSLLIDKDLTISGPGPEMLNVRGQGDQVPWFRVFNIESVTATIAGITISDGRIGGDGAGVRVQSGADMTITHCTIRGNTIPLNGRGAGIANFGSLLLINSTINGNRTEPRDGGGVANFGNLTIGACTFEGNRAQGHGGALYNASTGAVVIDSTFFNNSTGTSVPDFGGGAIYNGGLSSAGLTVSGCTFTGNFGGLGSDIANDGTEATAVTAVRSSLLQGGPSNLESRGAGGINSQGYNVCRSAGGGFLVATGDQINTDALLDPAGLQKNGGPTRTIALLSGSPAIDKGKHFGSVFDQRGQPRPVDNPAIPNAAGGDGTDVGAYEAPLDPLQPGQPIVNTTADHDDGVCGVSDCTLREAIVRSNAMVGANTISFAPGLSGTITLDRDLGPLIVTDSLTLTGPGARVLAVSANSEMRVLTFLGAGVNVSTVSGLTLRDGFHGFGLLPGATGFGGGVLNTARLTIEDCTLDDHYARGEQGPGLGGHGGAARGGGIYNDGLLTLNRCTLRNCITGGGEGTPDPDPFASGGNGGAAEGAAIYNAASGTLTVNNCTFFQNEASGGRGGDAHFAGNGGNAHGGAIFNAGIMTLTAATISGNKGLGGFGGIGSNIFNNGAPGAGTGGLTNAGGNATLRNTLCVGNTARGNVLADVNGTFLSGGYNLIGTADNSTGFTAAGDQTGTNATPLNAQLGTLQNNGGPTDTMMLFADSPAIDRGNAFGLTVDQRGLTRISDIPTLPNVSGGDGSDIGAVEFTGFLVVTTLDDHDDGMASPADTTLREAINTAIAQPGVEVISFLAGLTGIIQLTTALPNVSSSMFIEGPGAGLITVRRNSGGNYRIFTVSNGATVTVSGLTVANGNAGSGAFPADSGGGILNDHSNLTLRLCHIVSNNALSGFTYGGGVFNHEGTLVIESCTFSGNNAYYGGGVANYCVSAGSAETSVTASTFAGNTAAGGYGGAIFNSAVGADTNAPLGLINCTLSGNSAAGGFGGAIYTSAATNGIGGMTLTHCTLSGNSASSGGGIYNFSFNGDAPVFVRNNIFNTGDSGVNLVNNGGTLSSQGYNLSNDPASGDGTTGPGGLLTATGDVRNTDPLLGALASNGGPTQTHLPQRNSPVLDRGKSFGFSLDQRGLPRPVNAAHFPDAPGGDGADIGALEVNPFGSLTDGDGDGMPDEWEIFYGVDDPNGDPDNDGDTNLEEYLNETNPRDNGSFILRIISIGRSGNDVVITFNGVAGRTFRLERKDELSDPTWLSIPGLPDLTPLTTGNAQLTHIGGLSLDHSFYRVRLLP